MKISIRKDRLEQKATPQTHWFGDVMATDHDQAINRVDIDTSKGPIDVYVDGKLIKQKPKRYVLPLPGTEDSEGEYAYYAYKYEGRWEIEEAETEPDYAHQTVTQADLNDAPRWVLDIEPVEVRDE